MKAVEKTASEGIPSVTPCTPRIFVEYIFQVHFINDFVRRLFIFVSWQADAGSFSKNDPPSREDTDAE